MNKIYLLLITVAVLISTSIFAEKDKNGCDISRNFVKHLDIKNSALTSQSWKNAIDTDSDEYITIQKLTYKNGDMAEIEHKFCNMYNYELAYYVADKNFKSSAKSIAELINKISQKSVAIKTNFKTPLNKAITARLAPSDFSQSFDLDLNIPDTSNKNIEQSISYSIIKNNTSQYKYKIGYYIGIGGE